MTFSLSQVAQLTHSSYTLFTMMQRSFLPPTAWTVTDLNRYLRDILESDHNLNDLWVQGEISNFSRPRSGHLYFTIKDSSAALRCVMWRSAAERQTFLPKDGDAVEVHGSISVYEAGGQMQLYVDKIKPLGEGALFQAFVALKAKLEAEGLFDSDLKLPIPRWPRRIGIITSPTGAAFQDMLNTLRRRYPLVDVILVPSLMQGDGAPAAIVDALGALEQHIAPDLILLGRGGGSIEDLWAFNDERVARAIAACSIPIITGVGHETDFTIADFVADLRAPTPTAAAELAVPDRHDLLAALGDLQGHLTNLIAAKIENRRWVIQAVQNDLQRVSPAARIREHRQRIDELSARLGVAVRHRQTIQRSGIEALESRLNALNPLAVLQRGYAIISRLDDGVISKVGQVEDGDALSVRVSDGDFDVEVKKQSKKVKP
ncbi:MAG: exodeoxyribonuclease VII large subunit [Chloroflexota bacterium]